MRHLSAEPPTALDGALADARRYAMDLLRDRKGIAWRWRPSVPSLLRRQVLTGRLPAVVVAAVRESLPEYGSPWEPAVREWVLGAEGLNLSAQAEVASRAAAETIRQQAAQEPPEVPSGVPSQTALETAPPARPRRPAAPVPDGPRKPSQAAVRKASGADLAPYVAALLDADPQLTIEMVMGDLRIGRPKARDALRLATEARRRDRIQAVGKA